MLLCWYHPAALEHHTGRGHPERPERLVAIRDHLARAPLVGLVWREPPPATLEQIARAHARAHIERVRAAIPREGLRHLDPDTVVSPGSWEAALLSAGAAVAAVDAVMAGEVCRSFCCMRPPGHHAERSRAMGFCLFDNIAIGAHHARAVHGVKRIAIFDFDVHHGNGTQDIFWDDPDTLYCSTHQWPLYPGTGREEETGAAGNILNRTFPPGTDGARWRQVVERDMLPAIDAFKPELVMISAGFDAHAQDPLAALVLVEEDFAWITARLVEIAARHAQGRVVSVLEGGYHLTALAASVRAHLAALAGSATGG